MAHAYLVAGMPVQGDVALRVIDEKFYAHVLTENSLSLETWFAMPDAGSPSHETSEQDRAAEAREIVFRALRTGRPINDSLRNDFAREDIGLFREHELSAAVKIAIDPHMQKDEQRRRIKDFDVMPLRRARAPGSVL